MKKIFLALTSVVALALVGCTEKPYINAPGDNSQNIDSIPIMIPDTEGIEISIDSAIAICKTLQKDVETAEKYKITGVVTVNNTSPLSVPSQYTDINLTLSDNGGKTSLKCWYTKNLNNIPFRRSSQVPLVGSKITLLGPLVNYKGSTPEMTHGFIVRIDSLVAAQTINATCAEVKAAALALPNGATSTDFYVVEGYVQEAGYSSSISRGQQCFWMDDVKDGQKTLQAYWCNVPNSTAVPVGAKVRLTGQVMNFNGTTAEIKNGNVVVLEQPTSSGE